VSVAAPAPRTARPRRAASGTTRASSAARPTRRRRLSPAFLWIIVLSVLFAGIVALNVGALRGTIEASKIDARTAELKQQNADLASEVAGMSGYFRIATEAKRLGMVQSSPGAKAFIPFQPGTATPHHAPKTHAETPRHVAGRHPHPHPGP
jgi:cell division protein FtsL